MEDPVSCIVINFKCDKTLRPSSANFLPYSFDGGNRISVGWIEERITGYIPFVTILTRYEHCFRFTENLTRMSKLFIYRSQQGN